MFATPRKISGIYGAVGFGVWAGRAVEHTEQLIAMGGGNQSYPLVVKHKEEQWCGRLRLEEKITSTISIPKQAAKGYLFCFICYLNCRRGSNRCISPECQKCIIAPQRRHNDNTNTATLPHGATPQKNNRKCQ